MAKVIKFKAKPSKLDKHSVELLRIADQIDDVILRNLSEEVDPRDMAGLLAHRLGTLMRQVGRQDREILWEVVQKVLREQADLGKAK